MKALRRTTLAANALLYRCLPLLITATYIGILAVITGLLATAVAMALSDSNMIIIAATASATAGATAIVGVLAATRNRLPRV